MDEPLQVEGFSASLGCSAVGRSELLPARIARSVLDICEVVSKIF